MAVQKIEKAFTAEVEHIEPCMNCYGMFKYLTSDAMYDFVESRSIKTSYVHWPHCGEKTIVHHHSVALL